MAIPVYILTLADATERRQPLVDQLNSLGLPFTLWLGVDGRQGLPEQHEHLIDRVAARRKQRRDMGDGEFACALSHHFIYRDIIEKKFKCALVLEDDARIDTALPAFLQQVENQNIELLLLDHRKALVLPHQKLTFEGGQVAYRVLDQPYLASGYIVTRQGAIAIVENSLPISAPADWPFDVSDLRTYAIDPPIVRQQGASIPSYLSHERPEQPLLRVRPALSRYFTKSYWRRKYLKQNSKRIS
jgi:glycosyl transferase family 25